MRHILLIAALGWALLLRAAAPTTLRVVDLRWIDGQPELETWVGSLQGAVNRQGGDAAIFMVTDDDDAAWAEALVAAYRLTKEVYTPGALLDAYRGQLTGQVCYDPAQPWTRNLALTLAAAAPGLVIASAADLGVPVVQDLRAGWADRRAAYARALEPLMAKAEALVLAPEDGHLLADGIAARALPAVGLNPLDAEDAPLLRRLLARLPDGGQVLGHPGAADIEVAAVQRALLQLRDHRPVAYLPMRQCTNLSCFARFPLIRPLVQARDEMPPLQAAGTLALIYDAGPGIDHGAPTLDAALLELPALLDALSGTALPVGVTVPAALYRTAPALYQFLLARARRTAAELIAAPGSAPADARALDLAATALRGDEEAWPTPAAMTAAAASGWQGLFVVPPAEGGLPAWAGQLPAAAPPVLLASRVRTAAELRAALDALKGPNQVIFLDPRGLPPAELRAMAPEIARTHTLVAPSQLLRGKREYDVLAAAADAAKAAGRRFSRAAATLRVLIVPPPPTVADDQPLTVQVKITGAAPVLAARLSYRAPDGRAGAADLRPDGPLWSAVLPPMLTGGPLLLRARVVETGGLGEVLTGPVVVTVTSADADGDGVSDTLEAYQGSDPARPDSDGDGLPDSQDDAPTIFDRPVPALLPVYTPPTDAPLLAEPGRSAVQEGLRVIPAGETIAFRLPADSLPAAGVTLSLRSEGAGTVRVNGGAPAALATFPRGLVRTDLPLPAAALAAGTLRVEITAGEAPVRLAALAVTANPDGPYLYPPRLDQAFPPAGVAIRVRVTAFAPKGITSVTLKYGEKPGALKALPLQLEDGTGGVVYTGEIPAQYSGRLLVYGAEAADREGRVNATPLSVVPVGRTHAHSVALHGGRDLAGTWRPQPVWGDLGRVSTEGAAEDSHLFLARPGTYTVWLLAQPRLRGVTVRLYQTAITSTRPVEMLTRTVPAGNTDGWYRLGTFTVPSSQRVHVAVSPAGPSGYCAYGAVVLTQDDRFAPPLRHRPLDWYNSITIVGVLPGEVVSGRKRFFLRSTGNIDAMTVTARQVSGAVRAHDDYPVPVQGDGTYLLQTRNLLPGEYEITATGWRVVPGPNRQRISDPLVTATVRVVVPDH